MIDLDGDGHVDAYRIGDRHCQAFFQSTKHVSGQWKVDGWTRTRSIKKGTKDVFPDVSFTDPRVRLADMTGDGLTDIVFFYKNAVHYWPNVGHGDFGPRVKMTGLALPADYDPARVILADADGDGAADVIHVDHCKVQIFVNQQGNSFASEPITVMGTPRGTDTDAIRVMDLYGNGTPGILWHLQPTGHFGPRVYYLDLTGGTKPYLMTSVDNHMGSVTTVTYRSSTVDYVRDDLAGNTWQTPLPFPVLVVGNTTSIDQISGSKLTTEYSYHHGYWDGRDREFRGFGRVDARDTEVFDDYNTGTGFNTVAAAQFSPPRETRTWFHQGAVGDPYGTYDELDYTAEYSTHDTNMLDGVKPDLPTGFVDKRLALRTLRGSILRTELYALDGGSYESKPYTVTEAIFGSRKEEDAHADDPNQWPIYFPHALASRTTEWDRSDEPMTAFSFTSTYDGTKLTGDYDDYALPQSQTSIAVPRGRDPEDGTGGGLRRKIVPATAVVY